MNAWTRRMIVSGFVFAAVVCWQSPASAQYLSDVAAVTWMKLDKATRNIYIAGFLAGLHQVLKALDMDIRQREGVRIVTMELLSEEVYLKLLREPELRQGPIGQIVLQVVGPYIVITDRRGVPIETRQ